MNSATIALVTHQVVARGDGQGRVNYEIAQAALAAGFYLQIVAMRCDEALAVRHGVSFIELDYRRLPTQLLRNHAFARASTRWLRTHRGDYDLIHACGYVTEVPADVNTAHLVHRGWLQSGAYPFSWMGGPYSAYQRFYTVLNATLERRAFLSARRVVAISGKIEDELREIGVPEKHIALIHNGVDVREFYPGAGERNRFGLPPEGVIFLFAGDIRTPRKGLDTILKALFDVPGAHLAVAGTVEGSPFPAQALALGLEGRVHFLGKVVDMPALMRSVDLFVFPSRYEAMSLVILESMASGLPVLTAKTAGGAEILGEGGRVLDDPNDVSTLARWMRELAADPVLRQRMGAAGRAIAEHFTWERMATAYIDLYNELLSTKILPPRPMHHGGAS
ncbi:glycosyltransferase family 4 protein [Candidatus Igneacidithiobacillus taiwanensis]|uniref:glycosyltransferase family 4 protein n=1 Tax=Candidatus Igneacidithiobacillus taiwanensis TaxID=1945924 RepID=UPI0028A15446|nr:glycosyltransferase family 4 protein [Candidatus Igneacidithiobacillus taiwanensis]